MEENFQDIDQPVFVAPKKDQIKKPLSPKSLLLIGLGVLLLILLILLGLVSVRKGDTGLVPAPSPTPTSIPLPTETATQLGVLYRRWQDIKQEFDTISLEEEIFQPPVIDLQIHD
ncbi:MAG: hypothetical protein ABID04_04040 [Patescibacteria group bacterium]